MSGSLKKKAQTEVGLRSVLFIEYRMPVCVGKRHTLQCTVRGAAAVARPRVERSD